MRLTRREFAGALAALPLAAADEPRTAIKDAAESKATPFPLKQVRLLEGPFQEAMEANRAYLHSLEPERLLHTFRLNAGLKSTAQPLGGWERPECEVRGHFMGHYLTACAQMYAGAGDQALKSTGIMLVEGLAGCQKKNGGGYISAFPTEFFDRLKASKNVWAPWYTIHKILAGLLDMYTLCGEGLALEVAEGMAGWTRQWADPIDDEHMARILQTEFGGMMDVLFNLYGVTGNQAWADLARRFDHHRVFDPLAAGRDELKGLHVNTQIPKMIGAARGYELTGDERLKRIASFFWETVTQHRAYCTGGTSNFEAWRTEPDKLASELSHESQECCCTYNLLKLTRRLFSWSADARYADYYERALFNGILGTLNPEDGLTMYYVPLAPGYWKFFASPNDSFWCCTGTGVESFSKLADSIYFRDAGGLWVNLFIASELDWKERGMRVRQETDFPDREKTALVFETEKPQRLALRVRVPYWVQAGFGVKVNGEAQPGAARPGSYFTVERTWKNGDRVDVALPMNLRPHPMPDDDALEAVMYGPLVLAGELGAEGLTAEMMHADPAKPTVNALEGKPVAGPEFRVPSKDPAAWLKPVTGHPLTFRTEGQAKDVTFSPFSRLFGQRYGIYWRVKAG